MNVKNGLKVSFTFLKTTDFSRFQHIRSTASKLREKRSHLFLRWQRNIFMIKNTLKRSVIVFRRQNYNSDMLSVLSHSLVKWFQSLEHYCTIALLYIRICISYVRLNVLNPKLFKDILSLEKFIHLKVEMLLLSNLKSRSPVGALFQFEIVQARV